VRNRSNCPSVLVAAVHLHVNAKKFCAHQPPSLEIFRDRAGSRRDASPEIRPRDCRFRATIRCSLQPPLQKVPWKSNRVPGNPWSLDVEEKAICRYLDRLDKLGLPAQRELLRGTADYILLANWTPASPDEKPPPVGWQISRAVP
jgi:hypothetical protein